MPARSNEFQRLVFAIQRQLADYARVRESQFLINRKTGSAREVDIVVEVDIAGSTLVISVECTAVNRPVEVGWVERMSAKHQALPTNKLILLSKSGFTKDAITTAEIEGIEVLSFKEATDVDWTMVVGKLSHLFLAKPEVRPMYCVITFHVGAVLIFTDPDSAKRALLRYDDGKVLSSVYEFTLSLFQSKAVMQQILVSFQDPGTHPLTIEYRDDNILHLDPSPQEDTRILRMAFVAEIRVDERIPINLTHHSLRDTQIAVGNVDGLKRGARLTIVEHPGRPMSGVRCTPFFDSPTPVRC
jgi:hypothetical protein